MKKVLFFLAALVVSATSWAATVTFNATDYNGQGISGTGSKITKTIDGITMSSDKGYGNGTEVRIYSGAIITITASEAISKVELTSTASGTANYGPSKLDKNNSSDPATYTYANSVGTWQANDGASLTTVKLKATAQFRFTQVVVYTAGSTEVVNVESVSLSASTYDMTVGEQYTLTATVLPANASNKNVSWSSSDATKISVANGVVTANQYTTTPVTITVTTADGAKTATCAFTATKVNGARYTKVTDVNQLAVGDKVIFVNEAAAKASSSYEMSTSSKRTYLTATDAVVMNGEIAAENAMTFTLGQSGAYWTLTAADGTKLGMKSSDQARADMSATGTLTHTITFEEGVVKVSNTGDGGIRYIRYNSNSFRYYSAASVVADIQLYKRVPGSDPQMSLSASALAFDKKALAEGTATDQKTLTITASDLKNENITVAMKHGTVFSVTPASVASTGGTVTVSYTATAEGEYKDTVVVTGKDVNDTPIVRECAVSVTIDAAAPTGTDVTYKLLQNIDSLHVGDKVFFGTAKAVAYVMGVYPGSGKNIKTVTAAYSTDRHEVTANDLNAYTVVSITDGKYVFQGSDDKYLCSTGASNLSSTTTLGTNCNFTIRIVDDIATIKNGSNTVYYNNAALFSCYSSYDKNNMAEVILYSNNAPDYQEKVLHPAMEVLFGGVAVGDTLDWGEVVYDDSWGTEAAPYSEMKSLSVVGTDLPGAISVSVTGNAFSTYTSSLSATGGSLSVNFETNNEGTYLGTLTISCDTLTKTVILKAKAVREASEDPSTKPQITTDKVRVYLNPYFYNESGVEEMDIFHVSASNLKKNLYCKWLNSDGFSIPTGGKGTMSVSFDGYGDLTYGSTLNLGKDDIENLEVTVYVNAYYNQSYYSQLLFYTPDATNTSVNEVEHIVELVVEMSTEETPDPDPTHDPNVETPTSIPNITVTLGGKVLRSGQVRIVREEGIYDLNGRKIE